MTELICDVQGKEVSLMAQRVSKAEHYFSQSNVECSMHSCPELLKKGTHVYNTCKTSVKLLEQFFNNQILVLTELELFFPVLPMSPITVVTVTQKNQKLGTEELNRDQEKLLDHVSLTGKLLL